MINYLSKLIFPERCVFCSRPTKLHSAEPYICEECAEHMPYLNRRARLAEPTPGRIRGLSVFRYEAVKDTIFKMKYEGYRQYGKIMGNLMADYILENDMQVFLNADILVPVPLWSKKEKERGFNQAELLAEGISEKIGIPCVGHFICRTKNTTPQNGLEHEARRENMRNAFSINEKYSAVGKKVVIVDDIYTTGSTVFECAKTIFAAGAKDVYYLALSSPGGRYEMPEYDSGKLLRKIDIET
ncbi:MAG: ComF family protein [Clostridiales bacterium]|nr:ComF family protein [Clostridiales bacterium]